MEVRPGELSFVLGPSGSGKTTLARLIAGPGAASTTARIYFDGRLVHEESRPRPRWRVGLVFQEARPLVLFLTVAENIGYPLKIARGVAP